MKSDLEIAAGLAAPPHMGGGHHGGGFHHGGFRHRGFRHGGFGPRWWGPEVVVVEPQCTWTPTNVTSDVVRALNAATWQGGWRTALVNGTWFVETQSPHVYYVCVNAPVGFGMEFTEHPTPGDYHVNGTGVTLRAQPKYKSAVVATLQNGENVHVFGDVETDPDWRILKNDTVEANTPDSEWAGIDYVRVGTQTHGAGWIAMPYIEPGAGTKFGQQPSSTPATSPAPMILPKEGMGLVSKVLLGGAIGATIAGGMYLVWEAVKRSRPRRLAYA